MPVETWWFGHGRKYVLRHSSGTQARSLGSESCAVRDTGMIARVSGRSQRRAHATARFTKSSEPLAISQEGKSVR